MKTIKIDDVEYVRKDSMPEISGDYVIVRCRNAGVHAGHLDNRDENVLTLKNSRRLWRWWSDFSLSEIAMTGVKAGKEDECRFSCVVSRIDLTASDVAEVIYATEAAKIKIEGIKNANA